MSNKVQLIKQEIERRMNNLWYLIPEGEKVLKDDFTKNDANNLGKYTALESLLQFIDSLSEEPASEDLEEEIKNYFSGWCMRDSREQECFFQTARHFAEWQRKQLAENAVEGVIDIRKWPAKAQVEFYDRLPVFNVRTGDKVKIIIIKAE